ncbi:MAG: diguanylate cyclase, partial [Rubrivivax sp.]
MLLNLGLAAVMAGSDAVALARPNWAVLALALMLPVSLALLALLWRLVRAADNSRQRLLAAIEALPATFEFYDTDDRLVLYNAQLRQRYPHMAQHLDQRLSYEELARLNIAGGGHPDYAGRPEDWLAQRSAQRAQPGRHPPLLVPTNDGGWLQVHETRLDDGSTVAIRVDVSELVAQRVALEQARAEAELARTRLEDAIEALPAGFELYDAEDRLVMSNRQMADMYPLVTEMLLQRPSFEALVRSNFERGGLPVLEGDGVFEPWLVERLAQRRQAGDARLHQLRGGRWVRTYERPTREGGIVGVRVDVTEVMLQKAAAEQASMRLQDAIDVLPDAFALFDADDRLVVFNARYLHVFGDAATLQPGMRFEEILRLGLACGQYPQAAGREEAWLADRLERHRNPDGRAFLQEFAGNRWLWTDERRMRDGGVAGVRTDVTGMVHREQELQRLNERLDTLNLELSQLSDTDALTGLANRRHFDRRLAAEAARVRRHRMSLSLLLLDVDHFKRFNDQHGHPAGDACLRQVATLLASAARRPNDLVARIGGEEFAILLPHQDGDEAELVARHCLRALDGAAIAHGDSPVAGHVTLSVGIADASLLPEADAPALLAAADAALY